MNNNEENLETVILKTPDFWFGVFSKMARRALQFAAVITVALTLVSGYRVLALQEAAVRTAQAQSADQLSSLKGEMEGLRASLLVDMDRQVKASMTSLAPLLEPVSWYNPTVKAVPEVAAAKEESWTARLRSKLAAIAK